MSQVKKIADNRSKKKAGKKTPSVNDFSIWLICISLVLTVAAYLPALKAGFVNWDDPDYVLNNPYLRSFSNIRELLTLPVHGNYHPLTMLSLAWNFGFSGVQAASYHWFNLIVHLLNTFLVFKLAFRLSEGNKITAFASSLLFGIHPMHVESVAWISERKDVLYGFFFLLGLISYLKYADTKIRGAYFFSLGWFILSLASKPSAVIFPLVLFTFDFFRQRKFSWKLVVEKIPFLLFACLLGYLTLQGQKTAGATDAVQSYALGHRVLFFFYGFLMYFIKLVVPFELGAFHPFPAVNTSLPLIYFLSPLFFLAVITGCILTHKKYPVISFSFGFYLVNLLLVLQFFVVGSAVISERYTYIPYIGLFFLVGWLLSEKYKSKPLNGYAIVVMIGLVFCYVANVQARTWKNSLTLWQQVLKYNSTSSLAYENLARYYREDLKDYDAALKNFSEAMNYEPNKAGVYKGLGKTYFDKGGSEPDQEKRKQLIFLALENFNKGIKIDSVNNHPDKKITGEIYINRGSSLATIGMLEEALKDFNAGLEYDPLNQNGYYCRSLYYIITGNNVKAIEDHNRYLKLNPYNAEIFRERGVCKRNLKHYKESLDDLNKAMSLNSSDPVSILERARVFEAMGNHAAAKEDAQSAQRMGLNVEAELLR